MIRLSPFLPFTHWSESATRAGNGKKRFRSFLFWKNCQEYCRQRRATINKPFLLRLDRSSARSDGSHRQEELYESERKSHSWREGLHHAQRYVAICQSSWLETMASLLTSVLSCTGKMAIEASKWIIPLVEHSFSGHSHRAQHRSNWHAHRLRSKMKFSWSPPDNSQSHRK